MSRNTETSRIGKTYPYHDSKPDGNTTAQQLESKLIALISTEITTNFSWTDRKLRYNSMLNANSREFLLRQTRRASEQITRETLPLIKLLAHKVAYINSTTGFF